MLILSEALRITEYKHDNNKKKKKKKKKKKIWTTTLC